MVRWGMIPRQTYVEAVLTGLRRSPIVALLGPRQCGKTTLARQVTDGRAAAWLDLESPADLARLANPQRYLEAIAGLVVIDEVQIRPDLFPLLRVLVDRPDSPARFLILGSASPELVQRTSESLAGRVEFVEMGGLDLSEVGAGRLDQLWLRGGFPPSLLAAGDDDSLAWRDNFITTFLVRDVAQLHLAVSGEALRRFWTMLAHWHGQSWNASAIGRSLGVSDKTTRSYLDILTGTYLVRQLLPWHANLAKRQVRSPKVYLRDSGLLHALLSLPDREALYGHPRVGASWEGFCLEQALTAVRPAEAYFWGTHGGAEIDLLFPWRGRMYGVEVKWREQPKMTSSLHIAIEDLDLAHVWLIYPGAHRFPMHDRVTALPAESISDLPGLL